MSFKTIGTIYKSVTCKFVVLSHCPQFLNKFNVLLLIFSLVYVQGGGEGSLKPQGIGFCKIFERW